MNKEDVLGKEIALGELEGDASDEDIGGVLVLGVPRSLVEDAQRCLRRVDLLDLLHQR